MLNDISKSALLCKHVSAGGQPPWCLLSNWSSAQGAPKVLGAAEQMRFSAFYHKGTWGSICWQMHCACLGGSVRGVETLQLASLPPYISQHSGVRYDWG